MVGTATRQVGIVPISICCNKYYSNPPVKDQCINFMLFVKVSGTNVRQLNCFQFRCWEE